MKNIQLTDRIYHARIDLIVDLPNERRIPYLCQRFRLKPEDIKSRDRIENSAASYMQIRSMKVSEWEAGGQVIFLIFVLPRFTWTCRDIGSFCHELYHLVEDVFRSIGMAHTSETEEAFAYYYQMLMVQASWRLNKYWRKKRKGEKMNQQNKKEIECWTWHSHKVYKIKMEVTKIWRGKINLWDKAMRFRWMGTIKQFKREWN